jgi:hypothetical protein
MKRDMDKDIFEKTETYIYLAIHYLLLQEGIHASNTEGTHSGKQPRYHNTKPTGKSTRHQRRRRPRDNTRIHRGIQNTKTQKKINIQDALSNFQHKKT